MPKPKFTEQFLVTVSSDKPIKDLCDHVANRLWSLDHVTFIDVALIKSITPFDSIPVAQAGQSERKPMLDAQDI